MSDFEKIQAREAGLHKKLTARQMSMIAIGGAIGTGLFLGSKFAISFAGPGVIVSYALYRLLSKDSEEANASIAIAHYQAFSEALGSGTAAQLDSSPNKAKP